MGSVKRDGQLGATHENVTARRSGGPGRWISRRVMKGCAWACGGTVLLLVVLIGALFIFLNRVPQAYPLAVDPLAPPQPAGYAGFEWDGFESPYLGHTGS